MTTEQTVAAIAAVVYPAPVHLASAKDDSRPAFETVLIEGDNSGLRICGLDGFRMATYVSESVCEDEFKRYVPAPFMADLWKQRNANPKEHRRGDFYRTLHIMSDGGVGFIDAATKQMRTTSCPDVAWPDWTRILGEAVDDRLGGPEQTHKVREVGFYPKYLADLAKLFEGDITVRWLPGSPNAPQLFIAELDNGRLLYTLMPKHISDDKAFDPDTMEDWVTPKNLVLRRQIEALQKENAELRQAATAFTPNLKD